VNKKLLIYDVYLRCGLDIGSFFGVDGNIGRFEEVIVEVL
jgi:hypothetical protein